MTSNFASYGSSAPLPVPDAKIFTILKDNLDTPRVLYFTEELVMLQRHGTLKRTLLVSTKHHTYLIKQKGCKLYHRWANRDMLLQARQSELVIQSDGPTGTDEDEFNIVTLETSSPAEAVGIEDHLSILVSNAQRAAALLEIEEAGGANSRLAAMVAGLDEDEDASESSGSDAGEDGLTAVGAGSGARAAVGATTVGPGPDGGKKSAVSGDGQQGLMRIAPSRYIAITSLVDGEFADYTTLKNAYMRREEEDLLADLATFIKENEGQVEALCEHHYPAFIHAAQQCLAISERDAQLVGEELSGATALVRSSVVDMKQVAANLVLSRGTRDNLLQVRTLLSRAMTVVEYLETAEGQVRKQQLVGALASLRELVRLSAPMAEYALGEYVLQMRVPALTQDVFAHAIQHLNAWLKLLRDRARPMGQAALDWPGHVAAGSLAKRITSGPADGAWGLSQVFQPAFLHLAAYTEGDAVAAVSNGAAIQGVFYELRREEYFTRYYGEGRAQQAKADLFEAPMPAEGVPGAEAVTAFEGYCAAALGFMLIEDLVFHSTAPHVQSRSEVLATWGHVAGAVADRARAISQALVGDPQYAAFMAQVIALLRAIVEHATENVRCAELSALAIARAIEALSDSVVSWALQGACVECTQLILSDPFNPLTVNSAEQFAAGAGRFFLNACPQLELPVPQAYTTGTLTLPYSAIVPAIGDLVLRFLDQCFAVAATDPTSAVRQSELNNVDEMLLKYISVLFRTVAESLSGQLMMIPSRSVLQFATFVSSSSVMPVIVSSVEQRFLLSWAGDDGAGERQALGHPRLLAQSAAFFTKPVQKGIEGLLGAYMGELADRLKPTASFSFWRRQVEIRSGRQQRKEGGGGEEGMADCMDYALSLVPKLLSVLQRPVAQSIVGTAVANAGVTMQANIQTAIGDAYTRDGERDFPLMREVLGEFQAQCTLLVPQWQRRLAAAMPDLGAARRFPLNVSSVTEDVNRWLDQKEAQYTIDKANQPQLLAGLETTGKVMAKGFRAVGGAAAATANVFKRE